MKRPKQLPAVDRKSTKLVAVPTGANVRPAGILDTYSPLLSSYSSLL